MTQHNTRALVESALLAVLGTILVLLGEYVPFIGVVALFLWPLPSALVVLRHGMRWGVMASIVTALSLTLFMNWATALGLWVLFGLTGLAFGYAVTKEYSPAKIIVVTSGAFLIGLFTTFLSMYIVTGHSPMKLIDEWIRAMQVSAELSEKMLGPNQVLEMFKDFDELKAQLVRMLPAAVLLSALFQSYLNFEVLRRVLSRLGHDLEPLPPFSRWILPEYIAHGAIISYLSTLLGLYYNVLVVEQVGQNIFAALSILLLLETASVISYFLSRSRVPQIFSVLIIFYVAVTPVLSMLAVLFGIIDILFDFRQLRYGWLNTL
ncbi:MAG TPA: YybS family protein [Firmicutes bacterium]|nr:YybS family protein [Candidatus Fermentithermobacillaceae bacterium]